MTRSDFVKRRLALEKQKPAERAGLVVEGEKKWLTTIQNASLERLPKRIGSNPNQGGSDSSPAE